MNPFKCRHCSKPAHFYFREGGMLCPDHGALHATAQMKDMLERSRLDKSSCGGAESRSADETRQIADRSVLGSGSEKRFPVPADNAGIPNAATAGVASGPQDSVSDGVVASSLPSGESEPSVMLACTPSEYPFPSLGSKSPGALANTLLPVTAGAALSDDLPIFPARRKATAFLVADSSLIQVSASSSDILPQPSSVQV